MKKSKMLPYLLLLPCFLVVIILYGYPMVLTFINSFNKVNLLTGSSDFIGLANYKSIFNDPQFYKSLSVTVKYTIITVFLKIFLGFLLAYLLSSNIFAKKQFRFLVLIPWAIPQVAVSTLWKWILDGRYGYINYFFMKLGITKSPILFLSDPNIAIYCAAFVDAWLGISFVSMMFLAALEQIPTSLYEASEIDGANKTRQFFDITLPGIRQTFVTILILVTIWTFNSFNVIYVLTQGGPMRSTETLIIKIYQEAFSRFNIGASSALTMIVVVILSLMTFIYSRSMLNEK
ncbi:carbohydrate ABC transporter permease [Finegoldia magna]|uniref:carbohydrate ABC transporter permease n=1 Tax=Finegoldia magna TaxID=1260 RepID=UPI0007641404|nr:sugar ABC transporter permease [Finegoldia magna]KXA10522.1 ABC transporter, permease protein [Finegoldia magna]MBS6926885.1 sugar ABC transporter permease [Finegoldia magna]MDU1213221.1 sugar ABC transporter permease [Finegoldia magna]MDU5442317.1 sugar ABC transporter permease [Finegoldia magna]MDU5924406.1 sugar ABC transporter permease [Finegoldia magna]